MGADWLRSWQIWVECVVAVLTNLWIRIQVLLFPISLYCARLAALAKCSFVLPAVYTELHHA